jgi:hypothetical protein
MLMYVFVLSHFIETLPIGSWETNPCFFRGGLSQLVAEKDQGKTHMIASKNGNNVIGEECLTHIKTIVVSLGGKITYMFFYAITELHQRMYVVIFGVLILFCCLCL